MQKKQNISILIFSVIISVLIITGCNYQKEQKPINTAHKDWDLLDKPVKRAVWLWSVTPKIWDALDEEDPQPEEIGEKRFWNNYKGIQDLVIDFCNNKSINTIYFYNDAWYKSKYLKNGELENQDELAKFIKKANASGIKVWGLFYLFNKPDTMGNIQEGEHILAAQKIIDAYGKFNLKYRDAGFYGTQCDQEPNTDELFVPFIDFCKTATERAAQWNDTLQKVGARPFLFSQTYKPSYVTQKTIEYKGKLDTVARHLLAVSHHASFMDYTDNPDSFLKRGKTLLRWADEIEGDQKVVIGIETNNLRGMWPGSAGETYYEEITAENDSSRFNLFEKNLDKAELQFSKYDSYERIAIHSIRGYFHHWFNKSFSEIADEIDSARNK